MMVAGSAGRLVMVVLVAVLMMGIVRIGVNDARLMGMAVLPKVIQGERLRVAEADQEHQDPDHQGSRSRHGANSRAFWSEVQASARPLL